MADYSALSDNLIRSMQAEGFTITSKRPWWLRAAFCILTMVTRQDYSNYYQGINHTVYLGANWGKLSARAKYYMLIHERAHLLQFRRYSFPLMAFLYLFFPLPIGLAWFRLKFEREAMRAVYERKLYWGENIDFKWELERYHSKFAGPTYLYPWPFKKHLRKLLVEDLIELKGRT